MAKGPRDRLPAASGSEEVQTLKNQLHALEGADLRALQQLESISTAFQDLQSKFAAQSIALTEKEKQITKLLADKTKIEQRMAVATHEHNAIGNKILAVSKEISKVNAHCLDLEVLRDKQAGQLVTSLLCSTYQKEEEGGLTWSL